MTRSDILEEKIRAGRPEPSPAFTNRIRSTLMMLPEKKKVSVLRLLPAPAIVFAAVAVACLVIFNPGVLGGMPGSGGQQAVGGIPSETAVSTTLSTSPVESATAAPASTPLPQFYYPINVTYASDGYTETVVKAGTDGYVLDMETEWELPVDQSLTYMNTVYVTVDGYTYCISKGGIGGFESNATGTIKYSSGGRKPLLEKFDGDMMHVEVNSIIETYPAYDSNGKQIDDPFRYENQATKVASFQYSFNVPVTKPVEVKATANGDAVCGFKADLERMYRSNGSTMLVLSLQDNPNKDLEKYYNNQAGNANKNGWVELKDGFYITQIYKSIVDERITSTDPSDENNRYQFYMQGFLDPDYILMLKPDQGGNMLLNIILNGDVWPERNSYSPPGDGFTIISSDFFSGNEASQGTKTDYYYIMPE